MILADTSVWIDFFDSKDNEKVQLLESSLELEESIAFTGVILQEIFQGVNSKRERNVIEECFIPFIELYPQRSTYLLASDLYRDCRGHGFTIRSSIDCLIAACCIENDCKILHKDRDYDYICRVSNLRAAI